MKNVLYDYQIFNRQRFGGISRYFVELIQAFSEDTDINPILPPFFHINDHLGFDKKHPKRPLSNAPLHQLVELSRRASNVYNGLAISKQHYDLFHPTYFETYYLNRLKAPWVITIYDLIHELYPSQFSLKDPASTHKKQLCLAASKVIAISENTKKDLIEVHRIPEEKIIVTPLAATLENTTILDSMVEMLPENYVLFVGGRSGYKNFDTLWKAIIPLLKKDNNLHLVCTGARFSKQEIEAIHRENILQQVHHIAFNDQNMYTIYNLAKAFVFPSLYEGFGIPTLEAMMSNCPVILANTSSLPEVGGDAARYFDPLSVNDLSLNLQQVIYNENVRSALIEKGKQRATMFNWQHTASLTKSVYEKIS